MWDSGSGRWAAPSFATQPSFAAASPSAVPPGLNHAWTTIGCSTEGASVVLEGGATVPAADEGRTTGPPTGGGCTRAEAVSAGTFALWAGTFCLASPGTAGSP